MRLLKVSALISTLHCYSSMRAREDLGSLRPSEEASSILPIGSRPVPPSSALPSTEEFEDLSTSDWFKLRLLNRGTPTLPSEDECFLNDNLDEKEVYLETLWESVKSMNLPNMPEMKVVKYLGAGSFGTVLLVDIREMQRLKPEWFQKLTALMGGGEEGVGSNEQVLMVIKLMNYDYGEVGRDGKNTIKKTAREEVLGLQALKKVQSEIPVKGFGEIEFQNGLVILMEYIPGISMFNALSNDQLNLGEKLALIPSMFRGLAAMHEAGVYWGDLKHENLMLQTLHSSEVGPNGLRYRLRFIDMGLSTVFNEGEGCKEGNCPARGTPNFVPWNLVNRPKLDATRANFGYIDVFAAAVEAMVMLQGAPDYDALGEGVPITADINVIQNEVLLGLYSSKVYVEDESFAFLQPFYDELILPLARNEVITADQVCNMDFMGIFEEPRVLNVRTAVFPMMSKVKRERLLLLNA